MSASFKGDDKREIEVTGDGVDPVMLTCLLRKSLGHAELVSVTAVAVGEFDEHKEEKKPEVKPPEYVWTTPYNQPYYAHQVPSYTYVQHQYEPNSNCSIM